MKTQKKKLKKSQKEQSAGNLIAIDPASKVSGVSLFSPEGTLLGTWVLQSNHETWGDRLCEQACQFAELPIEHDKVTDIALECLKGASNSPMLNAVSGIFLQFLPNVKLKTSSFIVASKWKAFIRKKTGEKAPLPKGCNSLLIFDPEMPMMSEDEADSVMIGLTYLNYK